MDSLVKLAEPYLSLQVDSSPVHVSEGKNSIFIAMEKIKRKPPPVLVSQMWYYPCV